MNWVNVVWPMIAAVCLTLGAVQVLVWLQDRRSWANLVFGIMALCAAGFNLLELGSMRCSTVPEYLRFHRWFHIVGFGVLVSLVWFVRLYLGSGRLWLAWTATGLRAGVLILELALPFGINFREVTGITRVPLAGEMVSVPEAVPWALSRFAELTLLVCIIYVLDAAVTAWRRGRQRRAWLVGGSMALFLMMMSTLAALIHARVLQAPYLFSLTFLTVVGGVGYELSAEVVRAARLAKELGESEERMKLAADAALLGMWVWDLEMNQAWATEKCKELFGYAPGADVSYEAIMARVHPEDGARRETAMQTALKEGGKYESEFRILRPDGSTRWITSTGRVERGADGKARRMVGVAMDITERKQAQDAAREVSGRLITAQEDERRRIARDLHDDLNQRLAMLSVELEMYGRDNPDAGDEPSRRMQEMAEQVKGLSSEVHRLAYQLHPAKLDQLGLVAAARSYCRDLSEQSGVRIEFWHEDVTREVPADVELCVYRILQEACQNLVRHSEAKEARVELAVRNGILELKVRDGGKGFDLAAARRKGGLGMLSMEERVRLVHGQLKLQSEPGKGSTVELTVPLTLKSPACQF